MLGYAAITVPRDGFALFKIVDLQVGRVCSI